MVATVAIVAYQGLEARAVEVQVQLSTGLPAFVIVGLPDKAVAESRECVLAALSAIGLALSAQADHDQPVAGGSAQGRLALRSSHCALPAGGDWCDRRRKPVPLCRGW